MSKKGIRSCYNRYCFINYSSRNDYIFDYYFIRIFVIITTVNIFLEIYVYIFYIVLQKKSLERIKRVSNILFDNLFLICVIIAYENNLSIKIKDYIKIFLSKTWILLGKLTDRDYWFLMMIDWSMITIIKIISGMQINFFPFFFSNSRFYYLSSDFSRVWIGFSSYDSFNTPSSMHLNDPN